MKTLKNHERMELSWANNVYNTEFSVETRLEHGFASKIHVFAVKMTFCTLFSLLQLINVFRPHIVKNRKLTLFSWETLAKLLESVQKYVINRF